VRDRGEDTTARCDVERFESVLVARRLRAEVDRQNREEVLVDFAERRRGIECLAHPRLQVRLG
jgi:hypothetical protein